MTNPVLLKEFRVLLRERRGWLAPVLYAAVLAVVVLTTVTSQIAGSERVDPAAVGYSMALPVLILQCIALVLVGPVLGATAIAGERERSTWATLLASPVPRRQIATGKLIAGWGYVLVLLSVSTPFLALGMMLGGLDLLTLLGLQFAHAILAMSLVSLGMLVSTLFQRTWTAALVSLALAFGVAVCTVSLYASLRFAGGDDSWGVHVLLYLNPFYSLALALGGGKDSQALWDWWGHLGTLMGVCTLCTMLLLARLQQLRD